MGDILQPGVLFERLSGAEGIKADAESRQNLANFNAQVQEREAEAKKFAAAAESKRIASAARRAGGTLSAKLAAAGGLGSPVATDLAAEQAAEFELEDLLAGFEGRVGVGKSLEQAKLDRFQGKVIKEKGKSEATAANVKLATTLLAGF
jgi:predicted ATP-dependent protease